MNPWPYVALTVLGTIGMVAAMKPWYDELNTVVELEKATGQSTPMRQRRKLIFWAVPVAIFGLVGVVGDVGLIVYFVGRTMM